MTVGQETYDLPDPFFVIATQNPIEQEGTYPLPEAQLDRFMFNVKVDYPSVDEEKRILSMTAKDEAGGRAKGAQRQGDRQFAEAGAQRARRRLRHRLRDPAGAGHAAEGPDRAGVRQEDGRLGRRPAGGTVPDPGRARRSRRWTAASAWPSTTSARRPIPVMRHRIGTNFQAQAEGKTSEDIIAMLLKTVGEPEPPKYGAKKRL